MRRRRRGEQSADNGLDGPETRVMLVEQERGLITVDRPNARQGERER